MPNDTLKARSLPSAPSAALVGPDMESVYDELDEFEVDDDAQPAAVTPEALAFDVQCSDVLACANECYGIQQRLAWQVDGVCLQVRRLLLSAHSEVRTRSRGSSSGISKAPRKSRRGGGYVSQTIGQLFGCTLGNMMTYARGNKHTLKNARDRMETVVDPVSAALAYISGDDRPYLVRGLGHHRVVGHLGSRLPELRTCFEISDKSKARRAHISLAYGAVLAVLISFAVLSMAPADEELLEPLLEPACKEVHKMLRNWDARMGYVDDAARGAEERAAERALVAVQLARQRAREANLAPGDSVRMQLSFYRRAAWPSGERVGAAEQQSLLERLRSGELVEVDPVEQGRVANAMNAPGVLPLSQLSHMPRPGVLSDDMSSVSSRSLATSSNSWASGGSSAYSTSSAPLTTRDMMHTFYGMKV